MEDVPYMAGFCLHPGCELRALKWSMLLLIVVVQARVQIEQILGDFKHAPPEQGPMDTILEY